MTIEQIIDFLKDFSSPTGKPIKIMEVCGTHTASIFKNGIKSLISKDIQLVSGPGCPVCVTAPSYIDSLVDISLTPNCCVLTFGDMLKVQGSTASLLSAKAQGANVEILYTPLAAILIAKQNPNIQYTFAAVGFETTAPIYALLLDEIIANNLKNIKIFPALKTIIPAISFICESENDIDAFLCPGHVSTVIGSDAYSPLAKKYSKPFVVAGFDAELILVAIYEIICQIIGENPSAKNLYPSAVTSEGNVELRKIVDKYFAPSAAKWRGIGTLDNSGLSLKPEYIEYDATPAALLFQGEENDFSNVPQGCKCKDVILGKITPRECPLYKKVCTPTSAIGPCMVSSEGVCGIWYKNGG